MPVPDSSGWAGHPLFAHNAAISATIFGSVTRRASPATITSKPFVATLIVQRGSRATFFALRVRSPVWNQHEPARDERGGFRRRSGSSARTSSGSATAARRASGGRRAAFQLGTTRSSAAHRPHQGLLFSWFLRLHPFPKLIASGQRGPIDAVGFGSNTPLRRQGR